MFKNLRKGKGNVEDFTMFSQTNWSKNVFSFYNKTLKMRIIALFRLHLVQFLYFRGLETIGAEYIIIEKNTVYAAKRNAIGN